MDIVIPYTIMYCVNAIINTWEKLFEDNKRFVAAIYYFLSFKTNLLA